MIVKLPNDLYAIVDVGKGDGFFDVSREDLENLRRDIECEILNLDVKGENGWNLTNGIQ